MKTNFNEIFEGQAFVLGNNVANDGDLMALSFALARETDPDVLKAHIFAGIDRSLALRIKPNDIVIAGKRFGHGNPHIQGFLGLKGAGIGLLTESIPSSSYRLAINAGVPILPSCPNICSLAQTGDHLRVDFNTGEINNLTTGAEARHASPPAHVQKIIASGGWHQMFRIRLEASGLG